MSSPYNDKHRPLQIALVGAGLVGQRHAKVILELNDAVLVGIVDTADAAIDYANNLGIDCFTDLDALLEAKAVDGVVIATPTTLHVEQGLQCVAANLPSLIEKPIGVTTQESQLLVNASNEHDVPIIVGHHRRHNPLIHEVKRCIDSGELGDIRSIHSQCWFYKPDSYFEIAPWRTEPGAGPISVNLVHDVDLIRYFCGEVTHVQAQRAPSVRGHQNEDLATALLTLDNGALATITVSDSVVSPWSWELTSAEYPIYPNTSESCYRIGGNKGALSVPDLTLWSHRETPDWWSPIESKTLSFTPKDPLLNQMQHFLRVIRGEEKPLVSALEGHRSLQIIEAIQAASLTGERVEVNE